MKNNHLKIPNIGHGAHIEYVKPEAKYINGKSRHKCIYYNEETRRCSALNYIECVGVTHSMCKYLQKENLSKPLDEQSPRRVVNNGTTVILKEIHTGKEVKIKVNSHTNPEHKKLLGKGLKRNSIVEDWEGHTYIVWKIKQ